MISAPLDVRAELSVSQRQTLIRLRGELRNASQQYRRREFKPAASKVQGVQKELGNLLDKVSISDRKQLRTIYKTLERAHALLELEGVEMPALPKLEPRANDKAKPGAGESVSFARDVAPILALQCTGCHGGDRRRNGLSVANFSLLAKGGDSGPIVDRNEPEKSLLITKLRGTGPGQRMPLNRPPLNDATIEKFVEWIRDGAAFDGKNPGQDLTTMSALYRAQHASHSQLSQQRREIALRNWRLAMPDRRPVQTETVDFLVLGTDNENNLQEIGNAAQRYSANIRRLLRGTTEGPFINGRMTLFGIPPGKTRNKN